MRIVSRLTNLSEPLPAIDGRCFVGEDVLLRVTRAGFSLSYLPTQNTFWHNCPPSEKAAPERLLGRTDAALFAAFDDQALIGLAAVQTSTQGWGELLDIRVDVPYRRLGAGTMLLDACQRFTQDQYLAGLMAATSDQNPVMCQFCERSGFQLGGVDRLALSMTESERSKPMLRRACQLTFYRTNEKG